MQPMGTDSGNFQNFSVLFAEAVRPHSCERLDSTPPARLIDRPLPTSERTADREAFVTVFEADFGVNERLAGDLAGA